ncbi:siderophore-interacting protein [Ancylobacter sonchi]|uniref:siderophore-interacting protein n=1 Tax=Ancylobacter sonchi TaxID=1937790 RepID=UPI001BD4D0FD|nr:siderophore-interacting protein [Ancylobacter sonchi]MBS7535351.1 siderophore-interacting protein [Ancylobacter sonchi]
MSHPTFHDVSVARRRLLTPGMVRLTFAGAGLAAFRSTGIGDEYVRLFFPDPASGEMVLPEIDADGHWTFPAERERVRYATYTIRRFDKAAGELDIDFVVHEGGLASSWAQAAEPGDRIVINNPRGLYEPPADLGWQVLMADATGLPALARLLEQTPAHVESRIVIEVADRAHEQPLPPHPRATVTWSHGTGNGLAVSALDRQLAQIPRGDGVGYLWAAAEQKVARSIRNVARRLPAFADVPCKAVAYWIHGAEKRAPG